jgi:hypothetical protein
VYDRQRQIALLPRALVQALWKHHTFTNRRPKKQHGTGNCAYPRPFCGRDNKPSLFIVRLADQVAAGIIDSGPDDLHTSTTVVWRAMQSLVNLLYPCGVIRCNEPCYPLPVEHVLSHFMFRTRSHLLATSSARSVRTKQDSRGRNMHTERARHVAHRCTIPTMWPLLA